MEQEKKQENHTFCIGHFSIGKLNENEQRLLEFCFYHNLCITNAFFSTKPHHRTSWRHPISRHWHWADIITRRPSLNCVLITRSFHSADCDTDHSLVGGKVRFQPKRIHHSKQKGRPCINAARTAIPVLCGRFANSIEDALKDCLAGSAEEKWNHIRDAIYNTATDTFGKRERQNPDWFEASITVLEPAIGANRVALIKHKREPSNLRPKRKQDGTTEVSFRHHYNRPEQAGRWAEHYQELHSRDNIVADAAVESVINLPVMEELDILPSEDEISKVIDSLACGKTPGKNDILPEVIKAG
ncbi:uncharacterized protein LOC143294153 [Babylonia areolata]|uniref:uncharacterized protein LOC143294153 n=1 Tax=Babylonia areolata TaxID=304850 RepID=UPI003FD3E42D